MKKVFLFLLFAGLIPLNFSAQNIKSVILRTNNPNNYSAIVPLGTPLHLSFDDLEADGKDYQYRIQHMTPDWKPSRLLSSQYIDGFQQNTIIDVTNSFNTFQSYSHYRVSFPNPNTVITKSGNYLLSVLDDYDEVVFTRRFVLYENSVIVGVNVNRSRNTKTLGSEQTVEFSINHPNLRINIPNQEVKVCIIQNDNWSQTITNLQPTFFKPNQLLYTYTNKTNFWGGNEYLNFDSKQLLNRSLNVVKIERKDIFHHYLYPSKIDPNAPYRYNPDINGQFVIRTIEGKDNATEADYAAMHFTLNVDQPYIDKDVYVFGAFSNFEALEENKLTYSFDNKAYVGEILMKQGFYNYKYVLVDYNKVDENAIHGSHFQTENNYKVIAYYKPMGGLFYRAIGMGEGFFNPDR
ncbi:MAG: DUF5103 domain-containing protein [Flavobacteriaceae bacterium]|nr:DUF5103 domain-containing protein [Flavobacteriaceae bacterium]|tara:strand:+ start:95555 stop:96772 length:1218 start_codon:yes stop_codon:yes gene_type:complete